MAKYVFCIDPVCSCPPLEWIAPHSLRVSSYRGNTRGYLLQRMCISTEITYYVYQL